MKELYKIFACNKFSLFLILPKPMIFALPTLHIWLTWIPNMNCLDNSGVVGTIFMDLSKAFDWLPHELILAKLHAYGVDIKSLKLLQDYLSNRTQRVKLNSTFSSWLKVLLGVPQVSFLGSLLFNIFLNDMLWFVEKTDICNFADENTIYSCAKSVNDVIEHLQFDLKIVLK